jgi:NADH dehydrogenase
VFGFVETTDITTILYAMHLNDSNCRRGLGAVTVLNKLQNRFQTDVSVDITMISKDNYLLFTPMLHEIASGMIETRHIVTPIRTFCKRSRFYCAEVESIDLENKTVEIRSFLPSRSSNINVHSFSK